MTTYKDELTRAMIELGKNPAFRFIGYNVKYGSQANGTLAGVSSSQLVETPVAENLVAGLALGYALAGHPCLTWIERFDFMLNSLDAIVNHAAKINQLSDGQFRPGVIFRTIVGSRTKPLFTGATHVQDFSEQLRSMVPFPVISIRHPNQVFDEYFRAAATLHLHSTLLVEYRDLYDEPVQPELNLPLIHLAIPEPSTP